MFLNYTSMIITPFGLAEWLGTVGVSVREDSNGFFCFATGEYVSGGK